MSDERKAMSEINFTPRSQKLLQATKRIALAFNHDEILLPHLFAAFFELKQAKSFSFAVDLGLDLDKLKYVLYEEILSKCRNVLISFPLLSEP